MKKLFGLMIIVTFFAIAMDNLGARDLKTAVNPDFCGKEIIDDDNPCTLDKCNQATGRVTHKRVNVDDGIDCTADSCVPETGAIVHKKTDLCYCLPGFFIKEKSGYNCGSGDGYYCEAGELPWDLKNVACPEEYTEYWDDGIMIYWCVSDYPFVFPGCLPGYETEGVQYGPHHYIVKCQYIGFIPPWDYDDPSIPCQNSGAHYEYHKEKTWTYGGCGYDGYCCKY